MLYGEASLADLKASKSSAEREYLLPHLLVDTDTGYFQSNTYL